MSRKLVELKTRIDGTDVVQALIASRTRRWAFFARASMTNSMVRSPVKAAEANARGHAVVTASWPASCP